MNAINTFNEIHVIQNENTQSTNFQNEIDQHEIDRMATMYKSEKNEKLDHNRLEYDTNLDINSDMNLDAQNITIASMHESTNLYSNDDSWDMGTDNSISLCNHESTMCEKGTEVCLRCGEELHNDLASDADFRFFGNSDGKNKSDPSRLNFRKIEQKTIFKDLKNLELPNSIIEEANYLYSLVKQGKIQRGQTRKGIIFACVYTAFKNQGDPQTPEELQPKFDLKRKEASRGLNYFNLHIGKTQKPIYISSYQIIRKNMALLNADPLHVEQVVKLYDDIEKVSNILGKSNPQSRCCGLIYYYCKKIEKDISKDDFAKIVGLSAVTIIKISKQISEVLHTTDIVKIS